MIRLDAVDSNRPMLSDERLKCAQSVFTGCGGDLRMSSRNSTQLIRDKK